MRRMVPVVLVIAFLGSGCMLKGYYDACQSTPACVNKAHGIEVAADALTTVAVSSTAAAPAAPMAGKLVGKAALVLAMILFGHSVAPKKKEEEHE